MIHFTTKYKMDNYHLHTDENILGITPYISYVKGLRKQMEAVPGDGKFHTEDLWKHTEMTVSAVAKEQGINYDPLLLALAYCHDIGKIDTYDKWHNFNQHDMASYHMLRFHSLKFKELGHDYRRCVLLWLVKNHHVGLKVLSAKDERTMELMPEGLILECPDRSCYQLDIYTLLQFSLIDIHAHCGKVDTSGTESIMKSNLEYAKNLLGID